MARHSVFSRYTRHFNRRLALSVTLIAVSQFNYGFDNQAFATTQAMEAFNRQFGKCSAETNKCDIPSYLLSLLNSLPYIGFAVGKYCVDTSFGVDPGISLARH
jgi:MFS transporter, SP family, sugar:H+ symporter